MTRQDFDPTALDGPTVLLEYEFHFRRGEPIYLSAQQGRDTVAWGTKRIVITIRLGATEEVHAIRVKMLRAWKVSTHTLQPSPEAQMDALITRAVDAPSHG